MHSQMSLDPLPRIIKNIPRQYLRPNMWVSFAYLARDLVFAVVLVALLLKFRSPWIALPLSLILGLVMTGIFVIGHDAGHRSFSSNLAVNDTVGNILSALLMWPFHVWRLSHDTHHRYTHHIDKEVAWRPFSQEKVDRLSPYARFMYLSTRTWMFFVGSIFFTLYFVRDGLRGLKSRHFRPNEIASLYRSMTLTVAVATIMIGAACHAAGWYGFLFLILIPQLTFQFWMSTFTFFHHTHPDSPFMEEGTWDPSKAQLASTIHMRYPRWIEWLTHDISVHVPHHVCVGIPHYHLRAAHAALKKTYPNIVREETYNLSYVIKVINTCQIAGDRGNGYISWKKYQKPNLVSQVTAQS